jgi:hypothetical protein
MRLLRVTRTPSWDCHLIEDLEKRQSLIELAAMILNGGPACDDADGLDVLIYNVGDMAF